MNCLMQQQVPGELQELAEEYAKLRDISGAEAIESPELPWNYIVLALIALALLLVVVLNKIIKNNKIPVVLSPSDIAVEALKKIKDQGSFKNVDVKTFTYEVNMILRRFLEGEYQIRAPEQTTEDFLASEKLKKTINEDRYVHLQNFLNTCDLIKYADKKAGPEELEDLYQYSFNFVIGAL